MKRIALNCLGSNRNWIGGLYYIKNVAFQLYNANTISNKYKIYIFADRTQVDAFVGLPQDIQVVGIDCTSLNKYKILSVFLRYRISVVFPYNRDFNIFGIKGIGWIPDFQHNRMPEFFSNEEIEKRNKSYTGFAETDRRLILSSQDAYNDFINFYHPSNKNIYTMHFVSYIEPIIRELNELDVDAILDKYYLQHKSYSCIMNQFWQHKNHIVVFEAIKHYLTTNPDSSFQFVFTGKMEDYRNPGYIERLKRIADDPLVSEHIRILGFIDRDEQVAIMKNAEFVIQPSVFEGWGTVVEDAKVLNKTILLSDIPVHREQMNEKCILFEPHDPVVLASLIEEETKKEHYDDVGKGIADMHKRAKEYSRGFEVLLNDMEKKR